MTRLSILAVAVLCAACAAQSPFDRGRVSGEIAARGGTALRAAGNREAAIPPGVTLADGLSEDEAVAIALWNNAAFQAELAGLGVARADLIDAGMIRNPLLTLFLPWGPRQLEVTATLPLDALWQRGRRVAVAKLDVQRVAQALVQSGLDLIRDVKLLYIEVALAEERTRLARESRQLRGRIGQVSDARLRAGDISALEASAVRVDARLAEEQLLRQEELLASAELALRRALGLEGAEPRLLVASLRPDGRAPAGVEAAVKDALASRPDLRAAEVAIEAAGARLGWERTRIVSNLSAATKGSGQGTEWVIGPGFALEIPLFNQNQGPRARAYAEIDRALWLYAATRQRVVQEVRDAHRQYATAEKTRVLLSAEIIPLLEDNVRRTEKAYASGEVSFLFLLETMRQRIDASLREAEMTANLARAGAQLDRSIGRKLVR